MSMLSGSWAFEFSAGSTQHKESGRILLMLEYWAMPRHLGKITWIATWTEIKTYIHVQGQPSKGSLGRLAVWSRSTLLSFRIWPSFCYCFLLQSFNHLFLPQPTTLICTFRRKGTSYAHTLRSHWVSTQYLTLPVKYSKRLALAPISFFLSLLSVPILRWEDCCSCHAVLEYRRKNSPRKKVFDGPAIYCFMYVPNYSRALKLGWEPNYQFTLMT